VAGTKDLWGLIRRGIGKKVSTQQGNANLRVRRPARYDLWAISPTKGMRSMEKKKSRQVQQIIWTGRSQGLDRKIDYVTLRAESGHQKILSGGGRFSEYSSVKGAKGGAKK